MKKVNANIKSKEELKERLEKGERFKNKNNCELFYDESFIYKGESPYRFLTPDESGSYAILSWDCKYYKNFYIELTLEQRLDNGEKVLCRVSDFEDKLSCGNIRIVREFLNNESFPYRTAHEIGYNYAIELTENDLKYLGLKKLED